MTFAKKVLEVVAIVLVYIIQFQKEILGDARHVKLDSTKSPTPTLPATTAQLMPQAPPAVTSLLIACVTLVIVDPMGGGASSVCRIRTQTHWGAALVSSVLPIPRARQAVTPAQIVSVTLDTQELMVARVTNVL